jgi:hypothetical protein
VRRSARWRLSSVCSRASSAGASLLNLRLVNLHTACAAGPRPAARFANNLQLVRLRHANAAEVDRVLQFDEVRPFRVVDPIPPA